MHSDDVGPAIVCLSHLGWDHVWQRPQQLLSRLARRYPVLYINEPTIDPALSGPPSACLVERRGPVVAWQPVFPDRAEVYARWRACYAELVAELLVQHGWARRRGDELTAVRPIILWFYTPTPVYMAELLPASLVVFDVMDDLASFRGASADLALREAMLLRRADLVFAGGHTLFAARRERHANIHLFPSGVDLEHFASTLRPQTEVAEAIADLPRPVLGYYGVIDERIDLPLLDALATEHPEWSIVLVGPVSKIEPTSLPRRPNLHYPGQQPYSELPRFLKGFDVCLMPFAINGATRSISPTKALEYMAAHRPIVSTPVPDVVANWADVLSVADTPAAFGAAITAALHERVDERARREQRQRTVLAASTWDTIVARMGELIERELASDVPRASRHTP
jgi:UDP-galactopyranose mutase